MIVYLVNIMLILLWRVFFMHLPFKNNTKLYCGIVALQWTFISGCRAWSVGADTRAYSYSFERIKEFPWSRLLGNAFDYLFRGVKVKDPGYPLFVKLCQLFTGNYQVFLLIIACIFMSLMAVWIYRHSVAPAVSFILFSTLFYSFFAITGHRQTVATALIVFVGYDLMRERKHFQFAFITLIAYLLHKSSIFFVPLYFLTMVPVTQTYKIVAATAIAVSTALGKWLYAPIARWIGYSESQINYAKGGAELYASLLVALCLIIWIQFPKIKERRADADYLFHATVLAMLTALLTIQNQSFMRIQQYYSLFLMITIPEVLDTLRTDFRLLGYMIFGMVMILYLIKNNPHYAFFFM